MRTGGRDVRGLVEMALVMADVADEISMEGFFSDFSVRTKEDGSPVTTVDRKVEQALRDIVASNDRFAGFLGEELPPVLGLGRWVVDPIDGTRQFIEGSQRFATLIAFEVDDQPIVGVVSAPALGLRWWAGTGLGARLSLHGSVSAARVSVVSDPDRARILVPDGHPMSSQGRRMISETTDARGRMTAVSASWEAVRVASGEADVAVAEGAWWDVAPLPVIVREAGGAVSRYRTADMRVGIAMSNRVLARRRREATIAT